MPQQEKGGAVMPTERELETFLAYRSGEDHAWVDDGEDTELCINHGETRKAGL